MSRNVEIQEERRRRQKGHDGQRMRLSVDDSRLDPDYVYRFANDDEGRIYDLTVRDDYNPVTDREGLLKPDGTDMGAQVSTVVGTTTAGAAMRGVLLRKKRKFYEDDQREKQRAIDEKEASLKSGTVPGAGNGEMYVPDGSGIQLRHERS